MNSFPESESVDHLDDDTMIDTAPNFDSQPTPQFRDELQRALEQTHRQQAARRTLGAHVSEYQQELEEQRRQRRTRSLLASLFMLLIWLWWRGQRSTQPY